MQQDLIPMDHKELVRLLKFRYYFVERVRSIQFNANLSIVIGFAGAEFNTRRGRRVSTYTAFVLPVERYRKNLVIRRYSLVTEVRNELKYSEFPGNGLIVRTNSSLNFDLM